MNELLTAIKDFIEWYSSTALPRDTALALIDITKDAATRLYALALEYVAIMF